MQYSIKSCLFLMTALAVLICVLLSLLPQYTDYPVRMSREQAIAELENVHKKQNAVVFVELDTYIQPKWNRAQFKIIAQTVAKTVGRSKVHFAIIDFSSLSKEGYAPFSKWEGWDLIATRGNRPIRGAGELFWISKGKIIDSASALEFHSVDAAVAKTLAIFPVN